MTNVAVAKALQERRDSSAEYEDRTVFYVLKNLGVEPEYLPANGVYKQPQIKGLGNMATEPLTMTGQPSGPGRKFDYRGVKH